MKLINSLFSSSDSTSYGRVASCLTLLCVLVWSSVILIQKGEITDIPSNWFALVCVPFAISKTGETFKAIYAREKEETNAS